MPPQAEAAPTNPPKPRGEATNGSPRQHTTNDPTTSTVGTKHGVAVGSGVAAARSPRQEEPGSASHERQATCRQEEPGSTGDELAACRAQLAAAERKIGEQADSLRRREGEIATLREQLQGVQAALAGKQQAVEEQQAELERRASSADALQGRLEEMEQTSAELHSLNGRVTKGGSDKHTRGATRGAKAPW